MLDNNQEQALDFAKMYAIQHYHKHGEYAFDMAVTVEDVIQECSIAVIDALDGYSGRNDSSINTFLSGVLKHTMLNFDNREVGGMTPKGKEDAPTMVSMDTTLYTTEAGGEVNLHDLVPSPLDIEEEVLSMQRVEAVESMLDLVEDEDNAYILKRLFGLGGFDTSTQEELADELGINRANVSRRMTTALKNIREGTDYELEDLL